MGIVLYDFEGLDDSLSFVPLSARRLLDVSGRKLSLAGWQSLTEQQRWQIARAGAGERVVVEEAAILDDARPPATHVAAQPDPSAVWPPSELVNALGPARPLDEMRWQGLTSLDRYVLVKSAGKPEKLARAYDEILRSVSYSHLAVAGDLQAQDAARAPASRRSVASASVQTTRAVVEAVLGGRSARGDVLASARIAGVLAAKRTAELVPLSRPVRATLATIDFEPDASRGRLRIKATVEALDRGGVETEALLAAALASVTVCDMIRGDDRLASIEGVRIEPEGDGETDEAVGPDARDEP